jgi:hypothetical protein
MNLNNEIDINQEAMKQSGSGLSRRRFFQMAGIAAGAGLAAAACRRTPPSTYFVGSGDVGLLNYLYILKQVQADFYIQANNTPYYGMDESELQLIADLRDHQIAHRDFLQMILSSSAVPSVVINFSPITFAGRSSVLSYSALFEDLSVGAINGAIPLFSNTAYVPYLSKMATVDARHSAYVRDIATYGTFADSTVITSGLDQSLAPQSVMKTLETYIQTTFDASQLP